MKALMRIAGIAMAGLALLIHSSVSAQPDWTVNPADFEFTMTITGEAVFDCVTANNPEHIVAAFIGGECRGVAHFDTGFEDSELAYLTVYNNAPEGQQVEFRLWNAEENEIVETVKPLSFEENAIYGGLVSPFLFSDRYRVNTVSWDSLQLFDNSEAGDTLLELDVILDNGDTTSAPVSWVQDSLGTDNSSFEWQGSELMLTEDVNFILHPEYQIHIELTPNNTCPADTVLVLPVTNNNLPPTAILMDSDNIDENLPPATIVGELNTEDPTPNDSFVYSLVGGSGDWPDNGAFTISGDSLYAHRSFDYEHRNRYTIQVESVDEAGNSVIDTLDIHINDVIEFDDLRAGNLVTPNEDGHNDFFSIPNVELYSNYRLVIYNNIGSVLFEQDGHYSNDWAGETSSGKELPSGTYYYVFENRNDNSRRFKGEIHLYNSSKF